MPSADDVEQQAPGGVVAVALTHAGLVRTRNEDAVLVGSWWSQSPDSGVERLVLPPAGGLVAVADGLGGHPDGHLASAAAVEALRACVDEVDPLPVAQLVAAAGDAVRARAWENGSAGTATTLVLARFSPGAVVVANVGDSRCYATDGDALRLLSTDDTEQVAGSSGPRRSRTVLTRALGLRSGPSGSGSVHEVSAPARPGQRFLLCSDGVWGVVPGDVLEGEVTSAAPLDEVAARLLGLALQLGAPDNATLVLAEVAG